VNVRSASRQSGIAAKLVLGPIFEADFEDNAYGHRPKRDGAGAIKEVHRLICRGYTGVVDTDLSKYFETIPHSDLLKSVARRIVDRHVLRRIKHVFGELGVLHLRGVHIGLPP
jgi:RNA-directed DNA polymerase